MRRRHSPTGDAGLGEEAALERAQARTGASRELSAIGCVVAGRRGDELGEPARARIARRGQLERDVLGGRELIEQHADQPRLLGLLRSSAPSRVMWRISSRSSGVTAIVRHAIARRTPRRDARAM